MVTAVGKVMTFPGFLLCFGFCSINVLDSLICQLLIICENVCGRFFYLAQSVSFPFVFPHRHLNRVEIYNKFSCFLCNLT